jgi:putative transposase
LPRARRISWLNYHHLVVAEANGGTSLFIDDEDFKSYIRILRQMVRDRLLKVYAYCLLKKEIRLVVLPNRLMLSRIIQRLHGSHTARMNQKLDRVGHLFRGRFRTLIFSESDLIDVVRSVHLWPVRVGLLRRPEVYPYSSHGFYMGQNTSDMGDFLSINDVLTQFYGDLDGQRRAFGRFVEMLALEPDNFGIQEISPGIGGTKESAKELLTKAKNQPKSLKKSSVRALAERASLLLNISHEQLMGLSRRQDLVMARRLLATAAVVGAGRSITEVACFLKRDKAQISRLVAQGMDLLVNSEAFSHMFDSLKARGAIKNY